jgi:uncharacterized membrane protein
MSFSSILTQINLKHLIILFIVFTIFDVIGISLTTKDLWNQLVFNVSGKPLNVKYFPAFLAYILLGVGLYLIGFIHINPKNKIIDSLYYGFLFGLIVYGVFDFTNMAIFPNYDWKLGLFDIFWGIFVSTSVLLISSHLLLD